MSIPTWFTIDTRLGSISVHLETPQCFSAEMYAVDLQVPGATEEQKVRGSDENNQLYQVMFINHLGKINGTSARLAEACMLLLFIPSLAICIFRHDISLGCDSLMSFSCLSALVCFFS